MKIKLILLILLIMVFTQGCASANAEELKMSEKSHVLTEFTSVKLGMTREEVIGLIGEETDTRGSGIVWCRYELEDDWSVQLLFLGDQEKLIDMKIVDAQDDREFVLKRDEN